MVRLYGLQKVVERLQTMQQLHLLQVQESLVEAHLQQTKRQLEILLLIMKLEVEIITFLLVDQLENT